MKIYLIRHGETDWNFNDRIQGNIDIPLNEKGINQAKNIYPFFSNTNFDAVYTSSLERSIQTAKIITKNKYPIIQCYEFNERNFGDWQGKLWSEVYEQVPNLNELWEKQGSKFKYPNGESLEDMALRVSIKFKDILKNYLTFSNILIVIHGGPIKVILGEALNSNYEHLSKILKIKNCSLSILNYNSNLCIETLNYTFDDN